MNPAAEFARLLAIVLECDGQRAASYSTAEHYRAQGYTVMAAYDAIMDSRLVTARLFA